MKKIFKLVSVLTALAVAGFGFIACSDDDDDDDEKVVFDLREGISGTKVATYVGSYTEEDDEDGTTYCTDTITFYTSDSKNLFQVDEKMSNGGEVAYLTISSGTYTGDPTTNGTVVLTLTTIYEPNDDYTELESTDISSYGETISAIITSGKTKVEFDEDIGEVEFVKQ